MGDYYKITVQWLGGPVKLEFSTDPSQQFTTNAGDGHGGLLPHQKNAYLAILKEAIRMIEREDRRDKQIRQEVYSA